MIVEKNKVGIEARNTNDHAAAVALWAEDLQEQVRHGFTSVTEAFPDVRITVDEMIAEHDRGALRWTLHGTHLGTFQDISATGNTVYWSGIDFYTVTDGKITAFTREADNTKLLQQINFTRV